MSYLIKHVQKKYVNKDCPRGFCEDKESATKFKSIFAAMKYLGARGNKTIDDYNFVEINGIRQARNNVTTKANSHRRRWRTV